MKNPRNTVSSRSGAKIPVMPTKQAVLRKNNIHNQSLKNMGYGT